MSFAFEKCDINNRIKRAWQLVPDMGWPPQVVMQI